MEEIQMVFDRHKGAIYALYNRALRRDPRLAGKVVLRLTIAPSGKVTRCEVVASDLHAPALERRLVRRVSLFDFGAKAVAPITVTYPIEFLPS
ncbi:MAG: energy transducer TonB, partial [Nitrospirae bacterium]